jgi:hypothetical protein
MKFRFRTQTVQAFELIEIKPDLCPLAVAAAAGTPAETGSAEAWAACLAPPSSRHRAARARPCLVASLILAAMATAPLACAVKPGERERFYAARSAAVEPRPGDGALRLTVWPRVGREQTAMAAAERTTDMP